MIDRATVEHVARLARLALSPEETVRMAAELGGILEHIDRLAELDTAGVEPTAHAVDVAIVTRADEPGASLPAADVLASAPDTVDGMFRVPRILEHE